MMRSDELCCFLFPRPVKIRAFAVAVLVLAELSSSFFTPNVIAGLLSVPNQSEPKERQVTAGASVWTSGRRLTVDAKPVYTLQKDTHTVQQQTERSAPAAAIGYCLSNQNKRRKANRTPSPDPTDACWGGHSMACWGGFFNVLGRRHAGMLCTNKTQLTCV